MADDLNEIVPQENPDVRRTMLAEQLSALEETPEAKPDRPRDEQGKFAPKAETSTEKQPKQAVTEKVKEPVTASDATPEPAWKKPPASWKKETHELWATADPKLQEYAFQRETEMKAGVEPMRSKAQFADAVQKAVEPYLPTIQGLGVDVPTAISALMKADDTLRRSAPEQRKTYFLQLARQYGVDLSTAGAAPSDTPAAAENNNPMLVALQNEFHELKRGVTTWQQQQQQAENARYLNEIAQFKSSAEHFDEVKPSMIQLLQSGMAANLQEAYDKAIRLSDELSERVRAAKQAEADAAKRDTADRTAKAAKAAAVSVKSSAPGTRTPTKAQDRRSMLAEQFDSVEQRL